MKMISKKAQGEIITTVLIILLVLAAIVIVWQVVNRTVTTGGEQATAQSECIGLNLEITAASAATDTVTVTRKAGGTSKDVTAVILVNGQVKPTMDIAGLSPLESGTSAALAAPGLIAGTTPDVITLGAKIGTITCDVGAAPFTVTAA